MNTIQHACGTLKLSSAIIMLGLAGSILSFNGTGRAAVPDTAPAAVLDPDVGAPPDSAYQPQPARQKRSRPALPFKAAPPSAYTSTSLTDIRVSLKLDPRISGPTYGGEKWISPPTYTGANAQDTVSARALGIGEAGQSISVVPSWTASNPSMVSLSSPQGNPVEITVHHAGQSKLRVAAGGFSRDLSISATNVRNVLLVEISQ